jgi:hypothetical protein
MEDDSQAFITALENRHGCPVGWRTYATWYGNNHAIFREFGVFLYQCDNSFHFEDFERTPSILGFSLKPKRKQGTFIPYEGSFSPSEVVLTRPILKSTALRVIEGTYPTSRIRETHLFDRLFRQLVEMVVLTDGTIHFFELMDRKAFVAELHTEQEDR